MPVLLAHLARLRLYKDRHAIPERVLPLHPLTHAPLSDQRESSVSEAGHEGERVEGSGNNLLKALECPLGSYFASYLLSVLIPALSRDSSKDHGVPQDGE